MPRIELSYFSEDNQVRVFRAGSGSVTVGSDSACDLCLPGLAPAHVKIFASVEGFYAHELGGSVRINDRPGSGFVKDGDAIQLGEARALRLRLAEDTGPPPVAASPTAAAQANRREGQRPSVREDASIHQQTRPDGRQHRPALALTLGLIAPGAGQAYNGQPVLGLLVLVSSVLVVPWLAGMAAAWSRAKRLAAEGGRIGRGGMGWVVLHFWVVLNVVLTVAIGLTMAGVMQ